MGKARAYLRLTRIEHGVMTGLAVMAGFLAVKWCLCEALIIAFLSSVMVEASLFAFNDIFNMEEDRINSPDRPLVTGEVSKDEAVIIAILLAFSSIILASLLGKAPMLLLIMALSLGNLYNAYLKRFSIIGNITVAGLTASSFLYGSLATGLDVPEKTILFFMIAFLANVGREVVKGVRDLEGDVRVNICTLACEIGSEKAGKVASVFMLLAVALSFAAISYFANKLFFTALISLTDIIFIHGAYLMLKEPTPSNAGKLRNTTLIGMLIALASFVIP
ncbi:MAG: UbiA family prenyltransferase [Infirmifilum sp.]|uniref:UbiA family prenyltransferase n=1 Tax=Infirmifilum TaxID=2856573 RepID=UPI00069B841B|nr:UbiA family prenyltransferase [Infirmifilum uzonense]